MRALFCCWRTNWCILGEFAYVRREGGKLKLVRANIILSRTSRETASKRNWCETEVSCGNFSAILSIPSEGRGCLRDRTNRGAGIRSRPSSTEETHPCVANL